MQIIIISSNNTRHKHWHLTRSRLIILITMLVVLIGLGSTMLNKWLQTPATVTESAIPASLSSTALPSTASPVTPDKTEIQNFYAKQLGGLQAEAIRLKMLSEKLAKIAGIDTSEFSLDKPPAQGGIEEMETPLSQENFQAGVNKLSQDFAEQEQTLSALQQYLITNDSIKSAIPSGRPIKHGWISSFFGYRIDPFNGKKAFHGGLDFAGKEGSNVYAVADGIVTWVGKRGGYGGLVEVDHGNGYVTRYAHNEKIKVHVGERIRKGQVLALMGSTGRSTGPHVHFEILRDGKRVNPYSFVK